MTMPKQRIFPGILTDDWNALVQKFSAERIVPRLWERDRSLWVAEEDERPLVESNLCWLDLPEQIQPYISMVMNSAKTARDEGLDHVVFVAMGGSNLAAHAVMRQQESTAPKTTFLLDTTDPDALRNLESQIPLEKTLFAFASKSGKRIETHALLLYFMNRLTSMGISTPGRRFVAFTEKGSYLSTLATGYKFRNAFFDPPGIHSRYSGLIHFSIFLTAACQFDAATLVNSISAMKHACGPSAEIADNPAVTLASFLAAGERRGLHRLVLMSDYELNYFAYRIAQLVGISTAGNGRGLTPFHAQSNYGLEMLQRKCLVVMLTTGGQSNDQSVQTQQLRPLGIPTVEIAVQSATDFPAEIFKWEMATALACVPLGINCFQDENGHGNLGRVGGQLTEVMAQRESSLDTARVKEDGIHLYAEAQTRRRISSLSMREALQTFLDLRNADSYLAICAFFEFTPELIGVLRPLRDRMSDALGIPVQLSSGPRYLYALDKIYKTGPANGMFIVVTSQPAGDVPIPGADYSFGELQLALALSAFKGLEKTQRPTIRLHLLDGSEKGLKQLSDVVIQALSRIREDAGEP
jgi:hypothetical protein